MRQATFYAGVQARNACMQLTLLYKHESLSLARRTAARAAPSAAHMGEHRLVQLCPQNVKVLHFWADITTHGKVLSKTLQRSDVLLSELIAGVEDAEAHIGKLSQSPGRWMKVFDTDFDAALPLVGHLTRPVFCKRATRVSIDKLRTGVVTKLFLRGISASAS